MKYGYARVSTFEQNANLQKDALRQAGCDKIITEKKSGASEDRPLLNQILKAITEGDTLTVYRLDRLGRSLSHLIEVVGLLEGKKAHLQSLNESIDTSTAGGRLIFHMMGALAEFERSLIVERTTAGLAAARKRGVKLGRRPKLDAPQIKHAIELVAGGSSVTEVARTLSVGRSTLYRALKHISEKT